MYNYANKWRGIMTEAQTEQPKATKAPYKWLLYAIAAIFALSIAGFLAYKWPLFGVKQTTMASRNIDRVTAIEGRALAIDARIDQLQQNLMQLQAANTELVKQQAEQASAIAALKTTATGTTLSEHDVQNVEQLKSLAQELQNKLLQIHKIALLTAATNLQARIDSGRLFTAELALVKNLGTNDPAINANNLHAIEPFAASGIANQQMLLDDFTAQSNKLTAAGSDANTQTASGQKLLGWLKQQITVRHASGNLQGNQPADILARIEYYLKQANYAKANAELLRLPDSYKQALQPFSVKLRARIEADTAMQMMLQQLSDTTHSSLPLTNQIPAMP